jgi:hypothetical protein
MTTTETLINRLPEIITAAAALVAAVTGLFAAYWSYKGKQQSIANSESIGMVQTNVDAVKKLALTK